MLARQIVLDTETTGLNAASGHRIIEIGCIELINRKFTHKTFHFYLNPEREVDAESQVIHGLTNEFLQDKPLFNTVSQALYDFIKGAELIIHNAAFDVSFLNAEFSRTNICAKGIASICSINDTLVLAKRLHPGQKNNLNALCKRYSIDASKREFHGALLDAHLLAHVYLAMTGGQVDLFDTIEEHAELELLPTEVISQKDTLELHELYVLNANAKELQLHSEYLMAMKNKGKCHWLDEQL